MLPYVTATPQLHPQMRAVLEQSVPLPSDADVETMRRASVASKAQWNDVLLPSGMTVEETMASLPSGARPLRTYTPARASGADIVFLHGGGWAICNLDTHHAIFMHLAERIGRRVLALHPRQAPEHPFPAPFQDVVDFVEQLPGPVILAGDSAGANLALAAALELRERVPNKVEALVLAYGCYRLTTHTDSHHLFGDGRFGLSTARMALFWEWYCGTGAPRPPERDFADLSAQDFHGLPPTFVSAAELDVLRADSRWLKEALQEAGVRHRFTLYEGMAHGFLHYLKTVDAAREALNDIQAFLTDIEQAGERTCTS